MLAIFLVSLLAVSAVSAADNSTEDIVSMDEATDEVVNLENDNSNNLEISPDEIQSTNPSKSFTDLQNEIINASETGNVFNIETNYVFNNLTDMPEGVVIFKDNFTINGNGHRIDGDLQSRIFFVKAKNVTINNLTLINAYNSNGAALIIDDNCSATTNNVIFDNNFAQYGIVLVYGEYTSNNDRFIDGTSENNGVILVWNATATFNNAYMRSSEELSWGFIQAYQNSIIYVYDSKFENTTSQYSTAIYGDMEINIRNCTFANLHANFTAGSIALKDVKYGKIENCTFVNVTSQRNGGAIFIDLSKNPTIITVSDCNFDKCGSQFGGAILQLAGGLEIDNCNFTNNIALFDGGAVYTSFAYLKISKSLFDENALLYNESRGSFGGAIFFDNGIFILDKCTLTNNSAVTGGAVYTYDGNYTIVNNTFKSNHDLDGDFDDIFTEFDVTSAYLDDNTYSGPNSTSLNNEDYESYVFSPGIELVLLNNTIDIDSIPTKFDLRDWGWVTPVKNQGSMGACWAFGVSGAMESAILRYLGYVVSISENNMQDSSLRYYKYGMMGAIEGGNSNMGTSYAYSWLGVFPTEYEPFDQLGKISPIIATNSTIHFMDIIMFPPRQNGTDNDYVKRALLKYGGLAVNYYAAPEPPYYNANTSAQYYDEHVATNHVVTLVGWDDTYSASNFILTPPGDGAWICKNSWGESEGIDGYIYISYYDQTFIMDEGPYAYLLFNTENYNKNYQYNIQGAPFVFNQSTEYMNYFVAVDDDLIAGVGTYFNDTNVEYSIEVYVNDELKLVQNGVSPFPGVHTIQLDSYIPIEAGDEFSVKIKSNALPLAAGSRQHYMEGVSKFLYNGTWYDATDYNGVCYLKVFTVADTTQIIDNEDITVDYGSDSYFSVKVVTDKGHEVGAGKEVTFTINGKTTTVETDDDGIAKIKITDVPGTYKVTAECNGENCTNTVTVKLNLNTCKVTDNKDIKVDYDGGKYFSVKVVSADGKVVASGASVKFTINGKTTTVKTDSNGIAKIKITEVPKKYTITTAFNGKTYKNTVTVKQVLKAGKVTVKKTAKKFTLKARLKINGKLVKGKKITFKLNGKTYKVKTNSKGIAKKVLKKNVIKKLKKGKKYTVKVTYLKDTIKTTVKVK